MYIYMNAHYYVKGFTKVFSKAIVLHKPISDTNIRVAYGEFKKLYIFDKDDVPPEVLTEHAYRLFQNVNVKRTEYVIPNTIRMYYVNCDYILYPYLHFVSEEDMNQEPIKHILTNNYFLKGTTTHQNAVMILKLERDGVTGEYSINYWINNRIIIKPPHKQHGNTLVNLLIENKMETIFTENNKALLDMLQPNTQIDVQQVKNECVDLLSNQECVDLLLPNVNLYNYQKNDVEWIGNVERAVSEKCNTITYKYSLAFPVLNDQFIIYNNKLSYGMSTDPFQLTKTFEFFGGNIISEVGLGKTLTMLYHIFKQRDATNDRYVEFGDRCSYFYKRGRCKGTSCQREVHEIGSLYCKEHSRTPFVDKRCTRYRNLDDFNLNDWIMKIGGREYIRTRATLVICPNHLCDQWVQEYYSKFKATHRILLVVTSDQYSNLTFGDLLFADLVIISYNFLINKNFTDYSREYFGDYKDRMVVNYTNLREYFKNVLEANGQANGDRKVFTENLLHSKLTSFNLFYWERVVLDEVHEIQNMTRSELLQVTIRNFVSTYKWNISGTPFPKGLDSFIHLMSYISSYTNGIELARNNRGVQMSEYFTTDYWISMGMDSGIIKRCESLFRRNTRESVASEYAGNILRDFVKLLEFTDQERAIYDSYKGGTRNNYYDFLIKLCCHAELNADTKEMIRNCKTFDEIRDCMLNYNRTLLQKEQVRVKNSQADIDYYTNELTLYREPYTEWEEQRVGELNVRLNVAKRQNTMYKKNYTDISRTYNYLLSSVENLVTAGEELTCPICLDIIEPGSITITRCGHKFCWDCIYETHRVQASSSRSTDIKCPSCNTLMSHKELYLLKDTDREDTPKSDLQALIESTRSTKIGNIVHFLKTCLEVGDKVILFSQWDEILCKVGDILQRAKISIVYCSGTVYQRKRAITSFSKDQNINIILLSSRNAASGINLTVANKIILLEPIYGSREYRHNIESQAIGRADRLGQKRPIDIYRFIIKDTVEQDIYNNCIDDTRLRELRIE